MLINYRKLVFLVLSLQLFFAFAACGLASAEELEETEETSSIPSLPLTLQGSLTVNGEQISEGSEIMAYYKGNPVGKYTVETEGKLDILLNLAPNDYIDFENVEFSINGAEAELGFQESDLKAIKNAEGISGPVIKVDTLNSIVSSSSSDGSGNSKDANESTAMVASNDSSEDAKSAEVLEDGENGEDAVVQDESAKTGVDTKGDVDYTGKQPVFWVVLAITAILGAILIMRKKLVE